MSRVAVGVLGGGAWGTMLAQLLSQNTPTVLQWVRDPAVREEILRERTHRRALPGLALSERIEPQSELDTVVRRSETLIIAVPSRAFREVARAVGVSLQGDQHVIWGTRGLEEGTGARMSEILREETCARLVGALGGPAYADELKSGQPGALVVGSRFDAVVQRTQALLSSPVLRVYGNEDLLGVELAGGLATIISLVCGLSAGLGYGAGIRAVVLNRGLAEISRLGQAMGAQSDTFIGLAGLGDMSAAVMAGVSRSYRLGERLATGTQLDQAIRAIGVAECVPSTRVAWSLVQKYKVEAPLIHAMHQLLFDGASPDKLVRALMTRKSIYE